jgi:hypothetical protein
MKAQYLAIALLSSVVMPITAKAGSVTLSFEEVPDATDSIGFLDQGPTIYSAFVYIGPTANDVFGELQLTVTQDASGLFDGTVDIFGETSYTSVVLGKTSTPNGISYFLGSFEGASLSGSNNFQLPLPFLNETFTIPEQTGSSPFSATFELSPSIDGSLTMVAAPATPEASTWAMMLMGFVGLAYAGYRKARKPISIIASI